MIDPVDRLRVALAGRYAFQRELGVGGSATVYLAEDIKHRRQVAVKVLRPEFTSQLPGARFLREIEIAARLQHPHIVPLLDSGEAGGVLYLVMPYVEGESLRERLRRDRRLPLPDVIRILADVADALAYAHRKGVVHRDIKPDNILLAGRHALVTDFGVAKALSAATSRSRELTSGVALGTPAYMAPEQATADPRIDHRVDIYALGATAYELLAGRPPFVGLSAQEVLAAKVLDEPEPVEHHRPEVPAGLAAIIAKSLAKYPDHRWQTADELLAQLEPLVTPSGGVTPTDARPLPLVGRSGGRWRWAAAGTGALALTSVALLLAPRARRPAMPSTARQHQLTFTGDVTEAAISPDGQFLAFVVQRDSTRRLMVQGIRGGAALPIAEGPQLRGLVWSADGSEIRFGTSHLRQGGALYTVSRLGGPPRPIIRRNGAALSPDGSRVAVVSPLSSGRVVLVELATGDSSVADLRNEFTWTGDLGWSPRGDRLAVATLALERRRTGIVVINAAVGTHRQVVRDSALVAALVWSPAGDAIYYLRETGRVLTLMKVRIAPDGGALGQPTPLLSGLESVGEDWGQYEPPRLSISRDGRQIVYARRARRSNLARIRLDNRTRKLEPEPLTSGTALHAAARVSPDGRSLAFVRSEPEGESLNLMPLVGGAAEQVAQVEDANDVAWAPDGRALALTANEPGGLPGVWVYWRDTGVRKQFAVGRLTGGMTWWPGDRIIGQLAGNRSLAILDPVTGRDSVIRQVSDSGWVLWPRVSRDGRWLAVYWNRSSELGNGVWVISLTGAVRRRLIRETLRPLRWSEDGRLIYVADQGTNAESTVLRALPAGGGPGRILATLPPGTVIEDITGDGKTLIINQSERRGDAWLIENPDPVVR